MDFDQKVDFYIARNYLEDRLNGICLEFNRENGCYASYNCYHDLYHGLLTIKRQGHMECRYHINGELHGPSFDGTNGELKYTEYFLDTYLSTKTEQDPILLQQMFHRMKRCGFYIP